MRITRPLGQRIRTRNSDETAKAIRRRDYKNCHDVNIMKLDKFGICEPSYVGLDLEPLYPKEEPPKHIQIDFNGEKTKTRYEQIKEDLRWSRLGY